MLKNIFTIYRKALFNQIKIELFFCTSYLFFGSDERKLINLVRTFLLTTFLAILKQIIVI